MKVIAVNLASSHWTETRWYSWSEPELLRESQGSLPTSHSLQACLPVLLSPSHPALWNVKTSVLDWGFLYWCWFHSQACWSFGCHLVLIISKLQIWLGFHSQFTLIVYHWGHGVRHPAPGAFQFGLSLAFVCSLTKSSFYSFKHDGWKNVKRRILFMTQKLYDSQN